MDNAIIERIQKLLRLSESSNPHEASLAALRASELMLKYNISKAVLENAENPREKVEYNMFDKCEGKNRNYFRGDLASSIAYFFDAKIIWSSNDLWLVGTQNDMNAVRYLFNAILNQIDELCESAWWREGKWSGVHGKTWKNSFRQGCLDKIKSRLVERKNEFKSEFSSGSRELAVIDEHKTDISNFLKGMRLSTLNRAAPNVNQNAFNSGRAAGNGVNIGGNSSLGNTRRVPGKTIGIGMK